MWPDLVLVPTPLGAQEPRLQFGGKFSTVQEFVPKPTVEGFPVRVLPRDFRRDVQRLDPRSFQPASQRPRDKLWAVVAPQVLRKAPLRDQPFQHPHHIQVSKPPGHPELQGFPRILVHHAKRLRPSTIPSRSLVEVSCGAIEVQVTANAIRSSRVPAADFVTKCSF